MTLKLQSWYSMHGSARICFNQNQRWTFRWSRWNDVKFSSPPVVTQLWASIPCSTRMVRVAWENQWGFRCHRRSSSDIAGALDVGYQQQQQEQEQTQQEQEQEQEAMPEIPQIKTIEWCKFLLHHLKRRQRNLHRKGNEEGRLQYVKRLCR